MGQNLSLITAHDLADFKPETWIPFLQDQYHLTDTLASLPGTIGENIYRDGTLSDGGEITYIHLLGPLGSIQVGPKLVYLHTPENFHQFINKQDVQSTLLQYCWEFASSVGGESVAIMPSESIGQYASEWIECDLLFDAFLQKMTERFGESMNEVSEMDFRKHWHVTKIAA